MTARNGPNMNEVVGTLTGNKIGATFFIGLKTIDAVWATPEIVVVGSCVTPAGYGVGNHCLLVLDFLTYYLIVKTPPQTIRSGTKRLKTKMPLTKYNYTNVMKYIVLRYCLT